MVAIVSGYSSKFADLADFSEFQQALYFGYEVFSAIVKVRLSF